MERDVNGLMMQVKKVWESPGAEQVIEELLGKFVRSGTVTVALESLDLSLGKELWRDEAGFILTAYSEVLGTYRGPHDHGGGWVVYHVVSGEMEMGSYVLHPAEGNISKRGQEILGAGDGRLYGVGDIHDTRCLSAKAIVLRFTSRDLRVEERSGRMRRFELGGEA